MDDSIEWKEAKGGQSYSDDSENEQEEKFDAEDETLDGGSNELSDPIYRPISRDREDDNEIERVEQPCLEENLVYRKSYGAQTTRNFSHQQINLSLRRNITALADANQHKPKPAYASDTQPFDIWLENAIVAISPNADLLLFAGQSPEKITFIAKLRMEPISQYITRPLEIALDYNEQVTSLLCLPIMSVQKTALGSVDWTALVIGLSSGYVKFYTEQSVCLLSLKFCDEPVIGLKCQTQKNNSNSRSESHFATIVDEILITHRTSAVVADGIGLYENLRISKDEIVKNGSNYEPAYNLTNLPSILNCQKWKIEDPRGSLVLDAELLGTRRTTTFDSLISDSINFEHTPSKACARTMAFVGRNPFISCYREPKESGAHSYTELIGSIFSLWNKPQPSRAQLTEISQFSNMSLFDKERLATSIVSSPDKRLAAITDDFGRVLLVDVTNWLVIRVWKGYRSAQCGWIEVKRNPDRRVCPHASFLVIYAPKRGLLEVWSAQRGPRVAAFNVGKSCRLLYSGYKMLNMRAEVSQKNSTVNHLAEQSYSSHCYLLNAKSETIFAVELPYTYSLYKYGDLKSRDHLLIGELVNATQQDSEVELISEILHRIALSESLQVSIQKIANSLSPDKIVPIMENLINKIMKNYDNHSGEIMTNDDMSIIELCKRLIRLCIIFKDLSESTPHDLSLPDVNQRLIDQYEEHPQEIDEFSEQLGWSTSEILRYLSLLALDRSYRENRLTNPWPSMGEPLAWTEFISCFDLSRIDQRKISGDKESKKQDTRNIDKLSIRLQMFNSKFLNEDKVVKTALFMYNRLSETFYKSSQSSTKQSIETISRITNSYNYLEPSSRLALLFQFWLSTKLCNHWKMWAFLQNQVGQISDELKVIAMNEEDDKILIKTWKQIYELILESDNIYAAIIATATIKSDTLRIIQDNVKREKLESSELDSDNLNSDRRLSIDWECLCIDAERMSLLSQQLEDVFLLNLLLKYSPNDGHLIDSYLYRVPRISVANILRNGPTVVSELVAQWAVQSGVDLKIFTQPYGSGQSVDEVGAVISGPSIGPISPIHERSKLFSARSAHLDNEEHAKELLHHTKTSYPCSMEPDVILLNCVWEFCRRWANNSATADKTQLLKSAYDCLSLLSSVELRHKLASVAFKTFFQRTFERLVILVETNSTILNVKSSRLRDTLTRKEFNMGEECLEEFVQFCCDLSEFMLQTCNSGKQTHQTNKNSNQESTTEPHSGLLALDRWWATPTVVRMLDDDQRNNQNRNRRGSSEFSLESHSASSSSDQNGSGGGSSSLVRTILFTSNLLNINTLVEWNGLANLMNLIFKLKIVKAYPMTLIGEESRQILQFDLQQSPGGGTAIDIKSRSGSLNDLRQKFARKCILNIVCKMTEESNEFNEVDEYEDNEDIDTKQSTDTKSRSIQQQVAVLSSSNSSSTVKDNSNMFSGTNKTTTSNSGLLDDVVVDAMRDENNESMVLFANLLSLANEWQLNCDELYLELVFELYRCNHDKIASQISTRVLDQQTLSNGLLKICSQRVLVLFGLSPHVSGSDWRRRSDKWSIFQPNVASWLKSIQQEEMRREIACLNFSDSLKPTPVGTTKENNTYGVQIFVLHALRRRTKLVLESLTNYLDGQASRLAYDLLQLLESHLFDRSLMAEINTNAILDDLATSK